MSGFQEQLLAETCRDYELSNYYSIHTPNTKFDEALDIIEEELTKYFEGNLEYSIAEYMKSNILSWTNPTRNVNNDTHDLDRLVNIWVGFPAVNPEINESLYNKGFNPEVLNFDKHDGMLFWCGMSACGASDSTDNLCPTCQSTL